MITIKQAMQDYGLRYKELLKMCHENKIIASLSCEGVPTWYINRRSLEKFLDENSNIREGTDYGKDNG